jgi:hypothetical protein
LDEWRKNVSDMRVDPITVERTGKVLAKMEEKLMHEEAFKGLKAFITYFLIDKEKNKEWTSDLEMVALLEAISCVVKVQEETFSTYYDLQSEYAHLSGSLQISGRPRTHHAPLGKPDALMRDTLISRINGKKD